MEPKRNRSLAVPCGRAKAACRNLRYLINLLTMLSWGNGLKVLLLVAISPLASCTTVGPESRSAGHYFGYVRILDDAITPRGIKSGRVVTFGGWLDTGRGAGGSEGVGVGYRNEGFALLPRDCRLAILVTTDSQLAAVETLIRNYREGEACVTYRDEAD